ncbi:MAG: hypothetical protein WAX57_05365, partial [Minisyncoccia bacterium]
MNLVKNTRALMVLALLITSSFALAPLHAQADSLTVDFESYSLGTVNGQDGWTKTGGYDVEVVSSPVISGAQSLRLSNAVTSGSFG